MTPIKINHHCTHMWLGLLPEETFNTCKGKKWKENKQKEEIEMKTKSLLRIEEKQDSGQVQERGHSPNLKPCYTQLASDLASKKQYIYKGLFHSAQCQDLGIRIHEFSS